MRAASMTTARGSAVSASSARAAAPATRRGAAVVAAAPLLRRSSNNSNLRSSILPAPRALDLDWSDPDTLIGALGGVLADLLAHRRRQRHVAGGQVVPLLGQLAGVGSGCSPPGWLTHPGCLGH